MIDVDIVNNRICVTLDPEHPHFPTAHIALRSLLTVSDADAFSYYMGFDDFLAYRDRLNQLGLVYGRTISDAAWRYLTYLSEVDQYNAALKKGLNNQAILSTLNGNLKTPLYEDQVSGVSFLSYNRRVGLFDDMGAGKTIQALATILTLGDEVKRTLIICPRTVIYGFQREIKKHTHLKALSLPSGRKRALKYLKDNKSGDWDILLVHPENLISGQKGVGNIYGEIHRVLKSIPFDMYVIDEFHQYKNIDAKRTQCVLNLVNESRDRNGNWPRAILMTGTPVSETPINAYTALKVITGRMPHISRFENQYVVKKSIKITHKATAYKPERVVRVEKVVGFRNLDDLKRRIERVSIRRTKDDMKGFPDRVFTVRDVELGGRQKALYKTVCGEIVQELPTDSLVNLQRFLTENTKVLRLRQLLNHPCLLDEEGDSAKYEAVDEILEELFVDPAQKVILWTEYRKAVDKLWERYNDQYGAVKIYGGVGDDQLADIAQRFENEDKPRVAVCIPAKAGTGVDFLARARTAIYVDRPYSFTHYKQSLDRIHRRTGDLKTKLDRIRAQPATCIFLDGYQTVDELVRDKLMGKQDVVDALTTSNQKLIEIGRADLLRYLS